MKLMKRNQAIIYVVAIMIMTAGYLNYTNNINKKDVETSMQIESKDDTLLADIGDATFVNSDDVVTGEENKNSESNQEVANDEINKDENADNSDSQEATNNETDKSKETSNNDKNENTDNNKEDDSQETSNNEISKNNEVTNDDYFEQSRLERETMYSQMIETYEKLLNSDYSLETQKQTATEEISKINEQKNSIMICENLIKTKGFKNIVIFVNDESISVIVESDELTQEQVAQIQNIISREMKAKLENIHISTK